MDENQKKEIIDLVFGEDGLKVNLVKMFLDPFHQENPNGKFDHETTTANMREFIRMGLEKSKMRGAEIEIIITLYGPPAWATKQKFLRSRDLDPGMKEELAMYRLYSHCISPGY